MDDIRNIHQQLIAKVSFTQSMNLHKQLVSDICALPTELLSHIFVPWFMETIYMLPPHQKCVLPHCWQTCVNGGRIARSISQLPFTTHSLKVSSPVLKLDLFSAFTPVSTRLTKIEVAIDQMNAVSGMPHLYLNLSSLTIIASMKQQMWVCGRPITHQRPILTHESLMPFATWSRWFSLASQIAHILFNVTALLLECMQKSYAWESDRSEVVIWSRSIELKSRRL